MASFLIPEDKISEIRNAANIADVVSETVLLKKAGAGYVGLCPFHSEKTPSFSVNPQRQIFHCFGCGTGGNVFHFVMKQEGLSYPEAIKKLAERYGIEIPQPQLSPEQKNRMSERESLIGLNGMALQFFRRNLLESPSGQKAREYLERRRMKRETVDRFQVGYAPPGWDNLGRFLSGKRVSIELQEKSGLVIRRNTGSGSYDRFRDRIMFPISDVNGRVIGFGGRVMDDSQPKYLNSPETAVYSKSRSLYGLDAAKAKCRESGSVHLVEGYFDLLALHQNGVENAVATLGTAFTAEHLRLLRGFAETLILVFDSDDAGIKAAQRSVGLFMKAGVEARVLVLPTGHDPDTYVMEFGRDSFTEAVSRAKAVIPFLIDSAIHRHGLSTEGKIRIVDALREPLCSLEDRVARALYVKELAERLGADEASVAEKMRGTAKPEAGDLRASGKTCVNRMETQIVTMMVQFPRILPEIRRHRVLDHFEDALLKSVGERIAGSYGNPEPESSDDGDRDWVSAVLNLFDDQKQREMVASLAIREERWDEKGCSRLIGQFVHSRSRGKDDLIERIQAAERDGNHGLLLELLREKQNRARKIKPL